jgi:hypothetical protein
MLKRQITLFVGKRTAGKTALLLVLMVVFSLPEFFPADRAAAQPRPATPAAAPSSSGLKLIGTIRSSSFSGAVFSDSVGMQSFFRLYDQLPDGLKLVQILSNSILLKNAEGIQYELFISQELNAVVSAVPQPTVNAAGREGHPPSIIRSQRPSPRKTRSREQDEEP